MPEADTMAAAMDMAANTVTVTATVGTAIMTAMTAMINTTGQAGIVTIPTALTTKADLHYATGIHPAHPAAITTPQTCCHPAITKSRSSAQFA